MSVFLDQVKRGVGRAGKSERCTMQPERLSVYPIELY